MKFRAAFGRVVVKRLDSLDRPTEARIRARVKLLCTDPFDPRISKPLAHPKGYRSSRVGGWRIIFAVDLASSVVQILSL